MFSDGRDPEIDGEPLPLPRRERSILEYLMANKGRRVTKSQIFNFVYGLFDDGIDENVIESHISKLRKRLRQRLGIDPIDSQRFPRLQAHAGLTEPAFLLRRPRNLALRPLRTRPFFCDSRPPPWAVPG